MKPKIHLCGSLPFKVNLTSSVKILPLPLSDDLFLQVT